MESKRSNMMTAAVEDMKKSSPAGIMGESKKILEQQREALEEAQAGSYI